MERADKENDKVMVGTEEKKNYILNFYGNTINKKKYCMEANECLQRLGFGYSHWASLRNNVFSNAYFPDNNPKINALYQFTVEYARKEVQESLRAEEQNAQA